MKSDICSIITWNIWLLLNWYEVGTKSPDEVGRYIIPATLSVNNLSEL